MLNWFKHHTCPEDESEGTLLVDVETETVPQTDEDGNVLYYCSEGSHVFAVEEEEVSVQSERRRWWW
jgi:hypothetical protein